MVGGSGDGGVANDAYYESNGMKTPKDIFYSDKGPIYLQQNSNINLQRLCSQLQRTEATEATEPIPCHSYMKIYMCSILFSHYCLLVELQQALFISGCDSGAPHTITAMQREYYTRSESFLFFFRK